MRFGLSLRAVEEMLLEHDIEVSYETLRRWVSKFAPAIARGPRRCAYRPGDVWHLDEVRVTVRGETYRLWRAVDQTGLALDEILQRRRDAKAASRLLKKAGCPPKRIVTDEPRSYAAAKHALTPGFEHRSHKGLNNRARKQPSAVPIKRKGHGRTPHTGRIAEVHLDAFRHPQLLCLRCSL